MSLVQGPLRNLDLEIKDGIGESTVFTICNIYKVTLKCQGNGQKLKETKANSFDSIESARNIQFS